MQSLQFTRTRRSPNQSPSQKSLLRSPKPRSQSTLCTLTGPAPLPSHSASISCRLSAHTLYMMGPLGDTASLQGAMLG